MRRGALGIALAQIGQAASAEVLSGEAGRSVKIGKPAAHRESVLLIH